MGYKTQDNGSVLNTITILVVVSFCLLFSSCARYSSIDADAVCAAEEYYNNGGWGTKVESAKVIYNSSNISILELTIRGDQSGFVYVRHEGGSSYVSYGSVSYELEKATTSDSLSYFIQDLYQGVVMYGEIDEKPLSSAKSVWCLSIIAIAILMIFTIWFNNRAKVNKELNKENDIVKKYDDFFISDNIIHQIDSFAKTVLTFLTYALWVLYYYGRGMDFCFHFFFPFFILHIIDYYVIREKVNNEIEPAKDGIEDNVKHSIHDSYTIKERGKKSNNPILFILDYLFQWYPQRRVTLFFPLVVPALLLCPIPIFMGINRGTIISIYTILATCLLCFIAICALFRFDKIYRRLRHKHFKKHNLPGPYGWGTLDYNRNESYYSSWGFDGYGHGAGWVSGHYRSGHYRNGHWVSGHWVKSHWRN